MTHSLHFDQLKGMVARCSVEEKIQLMRTLEQDTFQIRLEHLRQQLNATEISLADITEEVEAVRQQRYAK